MWLINISIWTHANIGLVKQCLQGEYLTLSCLWTIIYICFKKSNPMHSKRKIKWSSIPLVPWEPQVPSFFLQYVTSPASPGSHFGPQPARGHIRYLGRSWARRFRLCREARDPGGYWSGLQQLWESERREMGEGVARKILKTNKQIKIMCKYNLKFR